MTDQAASLTRSVHWADDADPEAVAQWLAATLTKPGPHCLAVPGGSTPAPIFAALSKHPIDWPQVTIWLTDDRIVPHDHEASNFGLLQRTLGDTGARLIPLDMQTTPPRFDLVWLGMGEDGHIASLFPSSDPRLDTTEQMTRITPDPLPPHAPFDRLSLTLPALLNTQSIMLVLRGNAKKAVLDAAIAGKSDLPIARLLGAAKVPVTLFWSAT